MYSRGIEGVRFVNKPDAAATSRLICSGPRQRQYNNARDAEQILSVFFFPSPTPKQSSQVFDYTRVFDRRGEGMTRRKNVPVGNTILERRTRLMTVA